MVTQKEVKGARDQSSFGNLWRRLLVSYPAACGTTHSAVLEGGTPGYLCLLSPPLPLHRPLVRCLLPSAAQRQRETARRSERGSQAGLTLWPPTAGAEAATRPASLRKGRGGSVATNTRGKLGMYILYLLNTVTHTSIKQQCHAWETGTYVDAHAFLCFSPASLVLFRVNYLYYFLSRMCCVLSLALQLQPSPALISLAGACRWV